VGEGGIAGRRWTGGDGRGAGIWASTGRGKGGDADGDFGCVGLLDGAIGSTRKRRRVAGVGVAGVGALRCAAIVRRKRVD